MEGRFSTLKFDPSDDEMYRGLFFNVNVASPKHLQKVNFNTKGHFSTLNYNPSSGINFQRGIFFCVRESLNNVGSLF